MVDSLSIVVPAFNEELAITEVLTQILAGIPASVGEYEVIVVDDGSTDATGELVMNMAGSDGRIRYVRHDVNRGKGAALASGFGRAAMEWIFFTDADLQINISELPAFLSYAGDYDAVIGYRTGRSDSIVRIGLSKAYGSLVSFFLGFRIMDINCPFKLFRRSVLADSQLHSRGFFVDAELIYIILNNENRIKELGVASHPRLKGRSSVRFRHVLETLHEFFRFLREK
ncbi:MAG: glycosyltransferase family 2 protein [Nitrospiraceae bacterium]|nr:glycosyltransferase family 2 protein [Nitrospiraceae bacterium]